MSRPRTVGRPSNTDARRAQIVDALLAVMAKDGYAGATITRVAEQAGLAAGLIHYHFASKEEILVAAVAALAARVEARASSNVDGAPDSARARLHAFTDAHLSLGPGADPQAVAAWVVIGAEAMRQPEVHAIYARALTDTAEKTKTLVRACLAEEERPTRNAAGIAGAIVSAIEGLYRVGIATPELLPRGAAAPTLRRLVDALVAAESES